MPRYHYIKLTVSCLQPRSFGPGQLREAVEHLKTVPGVDDPAMHIGLKAETHVNAHKLKLRAQPFLRLSEILGKTPAEVWEMFDLDVDDQRRGLIDRSLGRKPVNYDEYM